jgi:hypothetical protein
MKLQRHTFEIIARQFETTDDDEIVVNLAAWRNQDHQGPYLATEVSPKYVAKEKATKKSDLDYFLYGDDEGDRT